MAIFTWACAALGMPLTVGSSNLWEETRVAEALAAYLPGEQIYWLDTEPQKTLALLKSTPKKDAQGLAILLNAPNDHPDHEKLIAPLREYLPGTGWSSLAVHMPYLHNSSDLYEIEQLYGNTEDRISKAIDLAREQSFGKIVLIGHGLSAAMAARFAADHPESALSGVVLISVPDYPRESWLNSTHSLRRISFPVLDIYAELDPTEVTRSAPARLEAARLAGRQGKKPRLELTPKVAELAANKSGNLRFRQKMVLGTGPYFTNRNPVLNKYIRSWMDDYAEMPGRQSRP